MKRFLSKKRVTWKKDLVDEVQIPAVDYIEESVEEQHEKIVRNLKLASINEKLNIIVRKNKPRAKLIEFPRDVCGAPRKTIWIAAVYNNHFITWPDLASKWIK